MQLICVINKKEFAIKEDCITLFGEINLLILNCYGKYVLSFKLLITLEFKNNNNIFLPT